MMQAAELVATSLEQVAERSEDIGEDIYQRFYRDSPQAEALMAHLDDLVRGKMAAEVFRLLMVEDFAAESSYLDFETRTHADSYSVEFSMYEELLGAVRSTVEELLGADWRAEYATAWDSQTKALLSEMSAALAAHD